MDHCRDVLNGIPNLGIGVKEVHFVANAPKQNSRMILQFLDRRLESLVLLPYRCFVIVIESMAFMPYPETCHYRQSFGMRLIQDLTRIVHAPSADGVPTDLHQKIQMTTTPLLL